MRSRRDRLETLCRVAAFGVLGWLLGDSLIPSTSREMLRASEAEVESSLPAWSRVPATTTLHSEFSRAPADWVIDWLAALRRSNHLVTWSGSPPAMAITAEALPDPRGGVRIEVAAPTGAKVVVSDEGGVIDSAHIGALGASVITPMVIGAVAAEVRGQRASVAVPDSAAVRAVAVLGGAGWEGKYIASALEERGWPVNARFSVAPNVDVTQGAPLVLDTARISAVIALDTLAASRAGDIERFVRSGGGLILAGTAAESRALRAIAPGVPGPRTRPVVHSADTMRLGATGFYPVASLNPGGVPLERRPDGISLAARRVDAGRVLQVGYDDSWRWRMAGTAGSEGAHREWWSRAVSSVAYVPAGPMRQPRLETNAAPLASLVGRLGPAQRSAPRISSRGKIDKRILIGLIMTLLIIEWGSRRLRGLR